MLFKAIRQVFLQIQYEIIQGAACYVIDMVMYFYFIKQIPMKFRIEESAVYAENGQQEKQAEACQYSGNHE